MVPRLDRIREHTESILGTTVKETNQDTHHHDKHGVWHPCCVMSENHIANESDAETAEWEQLANTGSQRGGARKGQG